MRTVGFGSPSIRIARPIPGSPTASPCVPGRSIRARAAALWAAALVTLASCAALQAPPAGLHPVPDPAARDWSDQGDPASLNAAIEQSIRYYRQLAPGTPFVYGDVTYSPAEMIESLELFRSLLDDRGTLAEGLARDFLVFETVAPGGTNLITGYYVPVIDGAREPTERLDVPLFARPQGLIEVRLERFAPDLPARRLMGRIEGNELVPFYSREEIQEQAALAGVAEPLAYVNQVDLFFLQIQGSGIVRLPDGEAMAVGYAATNGHPYRSLGAELIRRKAMQREQVTLQSIRAYLAEHPDEVRSLLYTNPSYIFFRPVTEGPLGNIQVPLTAGRSLAMDDRLVPKGGLAYFEVEVPVRDDLSMTRTVRRFALVQDTGGVIKGHGRADIFWGEGESAEWIAGHLKHPGRLFLLVARKDALRSFSARN